MSSKLNISETNIANLGSELEKNVKLSAAQGEPEWDTAGKVEGIQIWRIEQFKIVPVPKENYGNFHTGDSYIILHTWKKEDKFMYDVHFWLGRETTQDEAGTAAYKTVELDDYLGSLPVQYREVEGRESKRFRSYFDEFSVINGPGSADSGFNHVKPVEYRSRLLHINVSKYSGKPQLVIKEVPVSYKSLNSGDVFIYDGGVKIFQWNGKDSNGNEKVKAAEFCRKLHSLRKGLSEIIVCDEGDSDCKKFFEAIGGSGPVAEAIPDSPVKTHEKVLLRLSDSSGRMVSKVEATGKVTKGMFDSNDVFVLDGGYVIFVWVGRKASKDERRTALQQAIDYIKENSRPEDLPISRVLESSDNGEFDLLLDE